VIENLNARIKAWWVMVGADRAAFLAGKTGVVLLFAFASFTRPARVPDPDPRHARGDHYAMLAPSTSCCRAVLLVWIDWYGLYAIFIPVYAFLLMPIIGGRARRHHALPRARRRGAVGADDLRVLRQPRAGAAHPADPRLRGPQLLLIAFLVIVVQSSDVLQYVWGKLRAGTRSRRRCRPRRLVEGFVGGVASATALGAALYWITPFTPLQAAAMALVINLMGFFGGLVMSAIKRDRGVKDWGRMIEGHGGMLDRLDSVIFAAPMFFHITRYFWTD
jgi:phosphatidate cytidylyltransferase